MQTVLLNGEWVDPAKPALYVSERGFHYGDGVFETMLLKNGQVRFRDDHWQRLQHGCARLGIPAPDVALLTGELQMLCDQHQHGIIKLSLSRGRGERGYRPAVHAHATRLWQLSAAPVKRSEGICVRWCVTRLSRNAALAGIKHNNRLEQVLAQAEWRDAQIADGLMLDTEGELVCATMSNVFVVLEGVLVTPDLRFSGVHGVMRKNVLRLATQLGMQTEQRALRAEELPAAEEVFLSNAIRGIQPVVQLDQQYWPLGKLTQQLQQAVAAV